MRTVKSRVVVLAGPNGAGKSTAARLLLQGALRVDEYVNADTIAQGLSGFHPDRIALRAGRVTVQRLKELAESHADFAFETTLASRSFAPWLQKLTRHQYEFYLVFLWLSSPELAIRRVAGRVRMGGHDVPHETIRRRYHAGLRNLFALYQPLAMAWRVYDNSTEWGSRLIASGNGTAVKTVVDPSTWRRLKDEYGSSSKTNF